MEQDAFRLPHVASPPPRRLYDIGMRQSAAWGLYVVSGTTAHQAAVAMSLLLGGGMCYQGLISPEQLTGFIFYVQLVTSSSLAVCDQWGAIMEVRRRQGARLGDGHRQACVAPPTTHTHKTHTHTHTQHPRPRPSAPASACSSS